MRPRKFRPVFNSDGKLDTSSLTRAGEENIIEWLRNRFAGADPYFPLDRRSDEDPDALIVAILRQVGVGHPVSDIISGAVVKILKECQKAILDGPLPPDEVVFTVFRTALHFCEQLVLPLTAQWFMDEISMLAQNPHRWRSERISRDILYAAIQQAHARLYSSEKSWLNLLNQPEYSTFALLGLEFLFSSKLPHLETWWHTVSDSERHAELGSLVTDGLRRGDDPTTISIALREYGQNWPYELKEALNNALAENRMPAPFVEKSRLWIEPLAPSYDIVANLAPGGEQKLEVIKQQFYQENGYSSS
jgi:hypothetical protein